MKILSFGGGVQTTALAILAARKEVEIDAAIFADPGAEKPETYWYIEGYIKPLFKEAGIPYKEIPGQDITLKIKRNLVDHLYYYRAIPSVKRRWCSVQFKRRPIAAHLAEQDVKLVGFSYDELERAKPGDDSYPLIDLKLTGADCQHIISDYGWPVPVKSSCFFCPFQRPTEWNWLKIVHHELIEKAVLMEARFYEKRPDMKETEGLYGGKPLWKYAKGIQMEMPMLKEYSCWSGSCGH